MAGIREREFQNKVIEWSIPLGWRYTPGRSLPREPSQTVIVSHLRDAVVRLNPGVVGGFDVDQIVDQVIAGVTSVEGGLVAANERVVKLLRGRQEFRDTEGRWQALRLADTAGPFENTLVVSDEVVISVPGQRSRRFDLVYWVNGLPLVVMETKSPTAEATWATAAGDINDTYAVEYPWFFTPNVFCVASDGVRLRYGAAGAPLNVWQPFRSTTDNENLAGMADIQRSVELLLAPGNVLDILANFVLFDTSGGGTDRKLLPRYAQKEAAHLIHQRVLAGGDRGLVWHHQGSGKTLLMVFVASLLLADARTQSPTIILLSDRTQLVRQTSGVFTSAMGREFFHQPDTSAELRELLAAGVRGVISTTVHKFAGAGTGLNTRDNIVVMVDEAHRTQSDREGSLAGQMRAALPNAKFFGMTGTPVRTLATDTFALFGDLSDPGGVMHHYSATRSLLDEATVPIALDPHPVSFVVRDREMQAEFDEFVSEQGLDEQDKRTLSRKFGRLTSVFVNPDRIQAVCQNIVDHYLTTVYPNGMKAQVVAYNREMAVAYTDKINEILAGFEVGQQLANMLGPDGRPRHEKITAEVNISVSDSKDEDPAMRQFFMSEIVEEDQKRRFLTPDDPLSFLVVTAKLMTGFDAPNEGVLYLDKPLTAHTLFQAITRPNRTWVSPTGFTKTSGIVVDYIGLAEDVQRAVQDPTEGTRPGGGFVTDITELVAEFRTTFTRIEDSLAGVPDLDLAKNGFASVRAISAHLDEDKEAAKAFSKDYRLLAKVYPLVSADPRIARYEDTFALFGSVYVTMFKAATDEERKERLAALGPQVLAIINAHVHSFTVARTQEEPLILDANGLAVLRELMALFAPARPVDSGSSKPTAKEILDRIKTALDKGVDDRSPKYTALAERIKALRDRIIDGAEAALEFLSEALRVAKAVVEAAERPETVVTDADHVGVLTHIIREHAPRGITIAEKNLAEEIDEVVTQTMAQSWDNADARNRGVRRAAAAVFRRYRIKPVGEPYDSTVAYIEAHYLVD